MYRAVLRWGALSFLPAAALFYTGPGVSFAPKHALLQQAFKRVMLPVRIAKLATSPPDQVVLMPVKGVRVHQIVNTWHARRDRFRKHEGEDIFAPRGTPVYSATHGVVSRITDRMIGGRSVFVAGAGRRYYYYTHLDRYARIEVGDLVTPATVLGFVGNTGNARTTPCHLHFGIYGPRGAIDPLPLLADRRH